jgi:hypothetical protein
MMKGEKMTMQLIASLVVHHTVASPRQQVQRASVLAATLGFFTLCLVGRAGAQQGHDFKICEGEFALCAASTCQPSGGKITVNVIGGGTATFPEYNCTCPIFDGPAIADLNGGNMHGSCTPPHDQIWSFYQPRSNIPQAITNWSRLPSKSHAPPLVCGADLNQGNQQVNCFSFACDRAGEINGVPVATCHCALGESPAGQAVEPNTAFGTQADQGNTQICFDHPVGGALPTPP